MTTSAFFRHAPRASARALCIVIGFAACLTYLAAADVGAGPAQTDRTFTLADPPWAQAMRPALDVPIGAPGSASTVAARAALAIAKGRRTAVHDLAAVATALAITLFGLALIESGIAPFPVLLTMSAMVVGPMFWLRGVAWSNDALAPALAMIAVWAAWRWMHTGRRAFLMMSVVGGALAILEDSAWIVLLPGVAVVCWSRLSSSRQRLRAGLVLIAMAACAAWPFIARAILAGQLEGPMLTGGPPGPMTLWRESTLGVDAGSLVPALRTSLPGEFTLVGVAMAALGVAAISQTRSARYPLAVTVAMLLVWFWLAPRPAFEFVNMPLAISGWAAVAVGLATLYTRAVGRTGLPVALVIGLAILAPPALGRARAIASSVPASDSDLRHRLSYDLRVSDLPADMDVVAESRRADAALLLSARQSGRALTIVPQTIDHVIAASKDGRQVAALPGARANLERAGFIFERSGNGSVPLSIVAGQAPCVELTQGEPTDIRLQLASGSFSLYGAAPGIRPGATLVRLTGLADIPVDSAEPRRLRYEITSPRGAAEVTLRIPRASSPGAVVINLAGVPATAFASTEAEARVILCPVSRGTDLMLGERDSAQTVVGMRTAGAFGTGWHSPEADPDPFRWTAATRSAITITMARPGAVQVTVTATPAARPQRQPTIGLAVNECTLTTQPMPPGQGDYVWDVAASCWRKGANQVWLIQGPLVSPSESGSPDTRRMGARVGAIRLARLPRDQNAK